MSGYCAETEEKGRNTEHACRLIIIAGLTPSARKIPEKMI
jgi:hypothetical protein